MPHLSNANTSNVQGFFYHPAPDVQHMRAEGVNKHSRNFMRIAGALAVQAQWAKHIATKRNTLYVYHQPNNCATANLVREITVLAFTLTVWTSCLHIPATEATSCWKAPGGVFNYIRTLFVWEFASLEAKLEAQWGLVLYLNLQDMWRN